MVEVVPVHVHTHVCMCATLETVRDRPSRGVEVLGSSRYRFFCREIKFKIRGYCPGSFSISPLSTVVVLGLQNPSGIEALLLLRKERGSGRIRFG